MSADTLRRKSNPATEHSIVNKVEDCLVNPNAPATNDVDGNIEKIHEFALNVVQTINDEKLGIRHVNSPQKFVDSCIEGIHKNIDEISGTKLRDFATGVGKGAGREIGNVALRSTRPVTYRTVHESKEDDGTRRRYKEEITINCDSSVPELKLDGPPAEQILINSVRSGKSNAANKSSAKRTKIEEGEGEFGRLGSGVRGARGETSVKRYKTTTSYSDYVTEDEDHSDDEASLQNADSREVSTEPIIEIPETPPINGSRFNNTSSSSRFHTSSSYNSSGGSSISPRTSLSPRPYASAASRDTFTGTTARGASGGSRFGLTSGGHGHSHSHSSGGGHKHRAGGRSGSPDGSESDEEEGGDHFLRSKHCMHKDVDYAE